MTKYEVEIDSGIDREKVQRNTFQIPIIVRVFEDGQLVNEYRSKREVNK